ncbi:ABC transporter permease subunit [Halobaculum sp. P14]|uniref:ABC transporter permease subunit n=1 Tax=Halobaculum sp. P14 TaxID=3421638 RepID=UPI003EBC3664
MLEIAAYEARKRLRGAAAMAALLGVAAAFFVSVYPSFAVSLTPEQLDQLLSAYPDALMEAFNVRSLTTIEGFLATELYTAGWMLLVGIYVAYAAAGVVADDVDRGHIDLLLSLPVSRARLVAEKFAALLVPIIAINVTTPVVVVVASSAVGYPVDVVAVAMMHLLSIPYLLCCAAIGLTLSVSVDRASTAQRGALGVVFGLYLLETVVSGADYAWAGNVAPMRYLDPNAILLDHTYDLVGAGVLLGAAVVLVAASQLWFSRRDLS